MCCPVMAYYLSISLSVQNFRTCRAGDEMTFFWVCRVRKRTNLFAPKELKRWFDYCNAKNDYIRFMTEYL